MREIVLTLLMIALLAPVVTYLCVKLGTFAYYRGKQLFEEMRENDNGKK